MANLRCSVKTSDIALCVLSIPELVSNDGKVIIEDTVRELIDSSTYVLLNKADMSDEAQIALAKGSLPECAGTWAVSISTGDGLEEFVDSFGRMLNQRYVFTLALACRKRN